MNVKAAINDPDYKFYLVDIGSGKIESGWEFVEDAKDAAREAKQEGWSPKIVALSRLKMMGLDANNDANWVGGESKEVSAAINNPDYTFYVVNPADKKIESGWEFAEDAKDDAREAKGEGRTVKVLSRAGLKSLGIDPNNDQHWAGGPLSASARLSAAKDIGDTSGDKLRFKEMADLVKMAKDKTSSKQLSVLAEVVTAAGDIARAGEITERLKTMKAELQSSRSGDSEAVRLQRAVDDSRNLIDAMLPALKATWQTLVRQANSALSARNDVEQLTRALEEAKRQQMTEDTRLAAAGKAVSNSLLS